MRSLTHIPRVSPGRLAGLLLAWGGLGVLLVGVGYMVSHGHAKYLYVAFGIVALVVLAAKQRGAVIGILVLASMNGIPFVDTSPIVKSKITGEDLAVFTLLLIALAWNLSPTDRYKPTRIATVIARIGWALAAWWVWTLAYTATVRGVPVTHAASFGREYVFFALILILLPRVRLSNRDIGVMLAVLTAGVCVFAASQIMIATGHGNPGSLIHFHYTLAEHGLTRVYANMTDMVTAGVAVSVTAALAAHSRRIRIAAVPVAVLLTLSTIVQLTRARWVGLVVGLVLVTIWFAAGGAGGTGSVLRRRMALGAGGLLFAGALLLLGAPGLLTSGTVAHRLSELFSNIQGGGGTVAVREHVTAKLTSYLGGRWPTGLGFVPPSAHYYAGLPEGSLRDSDVGVLNALVTIGAVGAALIYLPMLTMLGRCLRRVPSPSRGEYAWLRYSGAVWIVATLVSSITLVTLFSASGLAMSGVFLAILVHPSVLQVQETAHATVASRGALRRAPRAQAGYEPLAS